jgi:hypothetical protein
MHHRDQEAPSGMPMPSMCVMDAAGCGRHAASMTHAAGYYSGQLVKLLIHP